MGPLELVERSPHPGCSTAPGLPSCRSTANGLPGPGLFYPRDLNAEVGRQPVVVSPVLCSYSRSHPKAEITGRRRDPQSTSGRHDRHHSLADVPLQFRVHVLGLEEVLPGRVQVFLQICNVEREGCQALLQLALLL